MTTKIQNTEAKTAISYVRFSTPEQELGDSERRQIALAKAYCQQHGLTLTDSVADKGVSAFHGKHHANGALGRLLKQMKPGQVLLIEDCDRWSREDPIDALTRLRDEVRRGIEVVFLRTGTRVTKDNFSDISVLVPNFFGALLGNGESAKKSERIAAVCQDRKAQVRSGKKVRLFKVPFWVAWRGDNTTGRYALIPEKVKAVEQMFTLAAEGHTLVEIVSRLKGQWCMKTVSRTLVNKAVIGYCQQVDPPVANFYPPAITEELFYRAQGRFGVVKQVRRHTGDETNLFAGFAKCAACGNPLVAHSSQHGAQARLICSGRAKGKSNCGFGGVPLSLIERSFLSLMANSDLLRPMLCGENPQVSKLDELRARLADAEKQASKLAKLILGDDEPSPTIYNALKREEARIKSLSAEIEQQQAAERANKPSMMLYNEFNAALPTLAKDLARRPELRRAISTVLEKLVLDPHGDGNGRWVYNVQLKGVAEPVTVITNLKPMGWCFQVPNKKRAIAA